MTGGLSKQTGAPLAAALINGAANKKMGPRGVSKAKQNCERFKIDNGCPSDK